MARAVSLHPHGPGEWVGAVSAVLAVLAALGAGLRWLWNAGTGREAAIAAREAAADEAKAEAERRIAEREERYIAKVEKRIAAIEAELLTIKRDYGVVVGVAHVMVDELIVVRPVNPSLALVAAKIREAYSSVPAETPSEMLHLLHRLDAAGSKGRGSE